MRQKAVLKMLSCLTGPATLDHELLVLRPGLCPFSERKTLDLGGASAPNHLARLKMGLDAKNACKKFSV